ncbi:MAG TPA: peptidase M1, partial [Bacteroidetes bacterium]|nr:peptidase M1 [Bacteroidota bacterium]
MTQLSKYSISFLLVILSMLPRSVYGFQTNPMDSGGPLIPEQAAFRVTYYDLAVDINPAERSLDGSLQVHAETVHPTEWLVLDLDTVFTIHGIYDATGVGQKYDRRTGKIWIQLGRMYQPGEFINRTISYSGKPRVAANPPWSGGFTWAQ